MEKYMKAYIKDHLIDSFVNNSGEIDEFFLYYEQQHEKETKIPADELEDNYDDMSKLLKDLALKIANRI